MRKKTFSLVLLLLAGLDLALGQTTNYDFIAVAPSGDTLYYKINGSTVSVVAPNDTSRYVDEWWNGYSQPSGNLVIPSTVSYGANSYTVTVIDTAALCNCSITSVSIPSTITTIRAFAFAYSELMSCVIPQSVTQIGKQAFYNCNSLDTLMVEPGNGVFDSRDSCNAIIKTDSNMIVVGCKSSTIPNSVTRIGNYAFLGCRGLVSITIPQNIVSIGWHAFNRCSNLSTVYYNADSCCNMGYTYWDDGSVSGWNPVFGWNDNFSTLIIGNNVKYIPRYAFSMCTGLRYVEIGDSVSRIHLNAFHGCNNVETMMFHCSNPPTNLDDEGYPSYYYPNTFGFYPSFSNTIFYIPCNSRPSYAVTGCWPSTRLFEMPECDSLHYYDFSARSLSNILYYKILDSTRVAVVHPLENDSVGNSYWTGYPKPTGMLVIPDSVEYDGNMYRVSYIGNHAFEKCFGITGIIISNSVDTVGDWSFAYDNNVYSLTFGMSVNYIGEGAFFGCGRLETVVVPSIPTSGGGGSSSGLYIGGSAFGGCRFGTYSFGGSTIGSGTFAGNTYLESVFISNSTTDIEDSSFYGCSNLKLVTTDSYSGIPEVWIPRSIRNVGNVAFGNCIAVTRVRYEADSCLRMGSDTLPVFMNDSQISSLVIGEYVKWIPDYAFLGCTGLDSITSYSTVAPSLGVDVFRDVDASIPVHIPCGSLASYTSRWSHFTNFIEAPITDTLTVLSANPTMGIAEVTEDASCSNGRTATIEATANYGYHFTMWSDGVVDNPRNVVVVCDTVMTALFERNEYTLTVVCEESQGFVSGAGVYLYGDTARVAIAANEGFVFNRWEETGDTLTAIEVVMNSDVTLTALFDTIYYSLTLGSNNSEWGSVSGGGEYAYGTEVEITATANDGYRFVQWSDGVTENPRVVVVVEDIELTAEFEEGVGIKTVEGMIVTMYPNPTTGLLNVEGEGVVRVEVYDLGGRRVMSVEHVCSIDMSALPAGEYYVRVVLANGIAVNKVVKM